MTQYTQQDLQVLQQQEEDFRYPVFTSKEALQLGLAIIEEAEKEDRGIVIRIVRESDGFVLFQYGMDDKAERNYVFAEMKRQCVLQYHHSSAWCYVANQLGMIDVQTSGGSFPVLLQDGTCTATVSVSGLHEGKDHTVILAALENIFHKKTVKFEKELV